MLDSASRSLSRRRQTWRFVWLLARQRIVDAYRGSGLGALWSVLPQLTQITVLALILGTVMQHRLGASAGGASVPYVVYMLPGVLLWQLFHDTLVNVADALPAQRLILKKNPVDLALIALYVPLAQSVPFGVGLALLWALVSLLWQPIAWGVIGVTLVAALCLVALAYLIGLTWGMVGVLVPDVRLALPALLQVGFWLTPIVYPAHIIPPALRAWVEWLHPWYGCFAPVQVAWTGLAPAVSAGAAWCMPAALALLHGALLMRMLRHGRKVVLDAL
ncbi:ABC-2 type transporter [Tepidimonas thermarum]|uniref:ABC-2 type transporter n=1 Tax=Tepidimonas thermarum TaxID=335431 RepID=A0A554X4K4_9BURK|nr:ABC-2 type transporter [Tepidimonas thermarum]